MNFLNLRKDHLKIQHDVTFYPYQEEISNRIINALTQNLRLTADATEEDIKKLKQIEIAIEISRQAGKTTAVVHTVELIMVFLSEIYKRPIHIGIYAPQIEQAKTDFERLKTALRPIKEMIVHDDETAKRIKEVENAKTLVLPNGSSCFISPVTATSKSESKTFDLMIFEEAQDIDDRIMKETIFPIGASTNAPRIFIGTAGTRLCYFRTLGQRNDAIKIYFEDIVKQRKEVYEKTGDAKHLIYENTVRQEIEKQGLESDEIQRPYFGKWLIGSGQFTTSEEIDKLVDSKRRQTYQDKSHDCYVGIDTAKNPDSTVMTIIRWNQERKTKELLSWIELRGDNYQDQFDVLNTVIQRYNVIALAIDSTGQGDFMPDMFERHTEFSSEKTGLFRIKFSAVSKDLMYKNLKVTIKESLTRLPDLAIKGGDRFRQQMLDLQQEYKGQLLSVHHPDDPNAHDDYPDSWALAEWAYARWNEENAVDISFVDYNEVDNGDAGQIQTDDYWPNATFD